MFSSPRQKGKQRKAPPIDMLPKEATLKLTLIASSTLLGPSRKLLVLGVAFFAIMVFGGGICLYYILFTKHLVEPAEILFESDGKTPSKKEWDGKDMFSAEELQALSNVDSSRRIMWLEKFAATIVGMAYGGVICYGAVKMQLLDSYLWAWVGTIMAIPGAIALGGLCYGLGLGLVLDGFSWVGIHHWDWRLNWRYFVTHWLCHDFTQAGHQGGICRIEGVRPETGEIGPGNQALLTAVIAGFPVVLAAIGIMFVLSHQNDNPDTQPTPPPSR